MKDTRYLQLVGKILPWSRFRGLCHAERTGKWVVCHGVFDILHLGHIAHLEWAKGQGDFLIVSVSPDRAVQKGPGRPHFSQEHRCRQVAALQVVDLVLPNPEVDAVTLLDALKPAVYVKGPDIERSPTLAFLREKEFVVKHGGECRFSPSEPEYHSTDLVDEIRQIPGGGYLTCEDYFEENQDGNVERPY